MIIEFAIIIIIFFILAEFPIMGLEFFIIMAESPIAVAKFLIMMAFAVAEYGTYVFLIAEDKFPIVEVESSIVIIGFPMWWLNFLSY